MIAVRWLVLAALLATAAPAFAQQCNCIVPATCKVGIPGPNGQCLPIAGSHLEPGVACTTANGLQAKCNAAGACDPDGIPCKSPDEGVCTSGGTYDSAGVCRVSKYPDGTPCPPNGVCKANQCVQAGRPLVCRCGGTPPHCKPCPK